MRKIEPVKFVVYKPNISNAWPARTEFEVSEGYLSLTDIRGVYKGKEHDGKQTIVVILVGGGSVNIIGELESFVKENNLL